MDTNQVKADTALTKRQISSTVLLGDLEFGPDITRPLGGLNPYSKHYTDIGDKFLQLFMHYGQLQVASKVLEIGCGTGRIARPLLQFLSGRGTYRGFDINKRFVQYCTDTYRRSAFKCCDVWHSEYNPNGVIPADSFEFPYLDSSFTFVCAIAVFNHMKLEWVQNYIQEIARVLTHKGVFFGTFILLNQPAMEFIDNKSKHPFQFEQRDDDAWYEYSARPLFNVALPEQSIRRACISNSLMIIEPIRYGEWRGSAAAITGHDVLIAIKN